MSTLGQYYIQVIPSAEGVSGKIQQIFEPEAQRAGQSSGGSFGKGLMATAGKVIAGSAVAIGAAITGVSTAVIKGASEFAAYGDNVDKMSQKMGLSAQAYQEWDAIMQHSGTSITSMQASMKTLANAVENGNGAFERIGLTMDDVSKMSNEELFAATISGLQQVENETERTYLAGQLLGRGATELGALLNTSAEDTEAMRQRVHELGGVLSDDAVKSAALFQDNLQDMQTAFAGVKRGIVANFLPGLNSIMEGFTSLIIGEEDATEKLSAGFDQVVQAVGNAGASLFETIGTIAGPLLESIGAVVPQIIEKAGSVIGEGARWIVQQLPAVITEGIPAFLSAITNIATQIVMALAETAPAIWDAGVELIAKLGEGMMSADMLTQGVEIITEITNGILSAIPQMITTAGELISSFAGFIVENLPVIAEKGADLINGLVSGIAQNLPQIVTSAFEVVMNLASTIVSNLPTIISAGMSLIGGVLSGLLGALPQLLAAIPGMVTSMASSFMSYVGTLISTFIEMGNQAMNALSNIDWHGVGMKVVEFIANGLAAAVHFGEKLLEMGQQAWDYVCNIDWLDLGSQIVNGIASGISNFASKGVEAIRSFGQGIKDGFASFFGINSPSTVMQEQGGYMVDGLVNGLAGLPDSVNGIFGELQAGLTAKISEIAAVVSAGFVSIGAAISNAWANMGTITATAWSGLSTTIGSSLSALAANVGVQVEGVKQRVGAAWQAIQNQTAAIWNSINTISAATWKTISNTITQILTAIQSKNTQIMTAIKVFIQNTWNAIKTNTASTWTTIQSTLNTIWSGLKTKANTDFTAIKKSVLDAWKEISSDTKTKWDEIKKTVTDAIDAIRKKAEDEFPKVKDAALKAFDDIAAGLPAKIAAIESAVDGLINAIKGKFSNDNGQWTAIGEGIADGIAGGISANTSVIEEAARAAAEAAERAARTQLGIASPSKVMRDKVGTMISEGIALGITDGESAIESAMRSAVGYRPELDTSYMRQGRAMQMPTAQTGGFTQNLTINSPRELPPSETARLNRIATQNTILKMRMA